jgi:hypothetical protein
MDKWYTHFSYKLPTLSDQERQFVEYITGRIPLLLRPLFKIKKFDEATFLRSPDLLKVNTDVFNFFMAQEKALKGRMKAEYVLSPQSAAFLQHFFRYYNIMEACLQQYLVAPDIKSLYDVRYFYVDEDQIGHYTCGVAFKSMMTLLGKYRSISG